MDLPIEVCYSFGVARVLFLPAIGRDDDDAVGGKAAALARLLAAGLPVPPGFVLRSGRGSLDAAERDALAAGYRQLGGGSVAVRSSATAEDLAEASFAGQYETFLDVGTEAAVLEAAAACRASLDRGVAYARALATEGEGGMAVLVQRFIEPEAAGVVFTRHPHERDAMLVESHRGRGEAVVGGTVTPDQYVVDRATGAVRGPAERNGLDAERLATVVALARRAEVVLGGPLDVEWAVDTDGVWLLQARPITVEAEEAGDPRARRLTRANVGEVLPDPVTPLTATTVLAFLEHGFRSVADRAGLLPPDPGPFLVLHRRRLYLNLDMCLEVGRRLPGLSAADAERLVLGGGTGVGAHPSLTASSLPALARVMIRLVDLQRSLPAAIRDAEERIAGLGGPRALEAADAPRLASELERLLDIGKSVAETHIATSGSSAFHLALLGRLLEGRVHDSTAVVNRLVAGLDGVESAAPTAALEAIAGQAAREPAWREWLQQPASDLAAALAHADGPPSLQQSLGGFLERFGHRAVSEGEIGARSWEEDPTPVLAALQTLLDSPRAQRFGSRARAEARRADEEALAWRLGPLRRPLFRLLLARTQDSVRRREHTKSLAIHLVNHGRRIARQAGPRLAGAGVLARPEDVLFLTASELIAALRGKPVPRALLQRRRRRHERESALPAPREVDLASPPGTADGAKDVEGRELVGIGVSAGVGSGRVRILDGSSAARLEPGDILVAPVLDAALGPLLAGAAAAVAEIGGMLSHGSVVARELGVPCVVDVRDATRRLREGEHVLVDGGRGRVWRVPEPSSEGTAPADTGGLVGSTHLAPVAAGAERLAILESHPDARESVYFNGQDPARGLALVAALGRRPGGRGEALLSIGLPDGQQLFAIQQARPLTGDGGFGVAGFATSWSPVGLRVRGRMARHDPGSFPPAPLPLLLTPATVEVSLDLRFRPSTPLLDFVDGLPPAVLEPLHALGRHHLEQSGVLEGVLEIDGRSQPVVATGSRDHSWGRRDWDAADYWRLFTVRFGDDLAVHALAVSVGGQVVEGGFLWRNGRAERLTRVEYAAERAGGRLRALELVVSSAAGAPLSLRGLVERTLVVPVSLEKRLRRHLAGHPYSLLLHENFTRYEAVGRTGYGMAEFTERRS